MKCKNCDKIHNILETLSDDCLAAIQPLTDEVIEAALRKGYQDRILWEQTQPTFPGFYH